MWPSGGPGIWGASCLQDQRELPFEAAEEGRLVSNKRKAGHGFRKSGRIGRSPDPPHLEGQPTSPRKWTSVSHGSVEKLLHATSAPLLVYQRVQPDGRPTEAKTEPHALDTRARQGGGGTDARQRSPPYQAPACKHGLTNHTLLQWHPHLNPRKAGLGQAQDTLQ